ncbi:hypothetical protein VC83_04965 [Pseudogymnoascus destructans]|nr:uncharacterized protein VC83_04965 [Pseudogymnoascus destructans]OAF58542.1 hypothetical protein VC83_04965 [Pseudogymnoascus destructans]
MREIVTSPMAGLARNSGTQINTPVNLHRSIENYLSMILTLRLGLNRVQNQIPTVANTSSQHLSNVIESPISFGDANSGLQAGIINGSVHTDFHHHVAPEDPLRLLPFATHVDLLQEIYDWADGKDERCIFWLNGLAGTGKSTISRTVARRYNEQKRLGASFFFSKGDGDVRASFSQVSPCSIMLPL